KLQVVVQLAYVGEAAADGSFWLAPQSPQHDGPETLLERLNREERNLPFRRGENDVRLVTRSRIAWVRPGAGVKAALVRPPAFAITRAEPVRVRLVDGTMFDGVLAMEMPQEFNRASDFLNRDEDFFVLTSPSGTVILNKLHVLETQVFEAPPQLKRDAA
ncbi:MAG TPA: hypothetical protein VGU27_08345, partial [Candidatus Eisenbacteria bacterium]|nr:hypothetical protein [Candidatus Eisenbacteria bacterium]